MSGWPWRSPLMGCHSRQETPICTVVSFRDFKLEIPLYTHVRVSDLVLKADDRLVLVLNADELSDADELPLPNKETDLGREVSCPVELVGH